MCVCSLTVLSPRPARSTLIRLSRSQVNTYWNWADVHVADAYADKVAQWSKSEVSGEQCVPIFSLESNPRLAKLTLSLCRRSRGIKLAFEELGLSTAQQSYTFDLPSNSVRPALARSNPQAPLAHVPLSQSLSGINTYAILPAPKTDGAEALVLSASWLSRATNDDGSRRVNTRGVALVLALANYFKSASRLTSPRSHTSLELMLSLAEHSMWSKDIIFLVSDGHVDGAQAWLDSYHGFKQSSASSFATCHSLASRN